VRLPVPPSRTCRILLARRAASTLSSSRTAPGESTLRLSSAFERDGSRGVGAHLATHLRSFRRDLINMAKSRTNVIPIIEDARHPLKYRMLVGMVDVVFADVAQPDQGRIVALNAHHFLKNQGHFMISIKVRACVVFFLQVGALTYSLFFVCPAQASCIDSTASAEAVFAREVAKLQEENFKPLEQLTLEPYERDHAVVVGVYRPLKKKK